LYETTLPRTAGEGELNVVFFRRINDVGIVINGNSDVDITLLVD
jgi:hypothetical protein